MKYLIATLLIVALVGIGFFFGPTIWAQGKGIYQTGKGKFGNFHVEIQRHHGGGCKISSDEQANEAYEELQESLTEIDGEAREFRGEMESFIGGLTRNIGEMEKQLRRSRVRMDGLGAAVGADAAAKARVEALRIAQAKREEMVKALESIKARLSEAAQEWERVIAGAGTIDVADEPPAALEDAPSDLVEADQPLSMPVAAPDQSSAPESPDENGVNPKERESSTPGDQPRSDEATEETEF